MEKLSKTNWLEELDTDECIRGVADKSLSRPGRKQATATKLGIYSTYSPRSSIHFLVCCSNLWKPLKKKIQNMVRPTRSPRQQWPPGRTKNGYLSILFSVQGTAGSPTGPYPENRVGDQDIWSPGRPVSSVLQVAGEPGHCEFPARFFLKNVLQLHQQRLIIFRVDSLALWKIINEENAFLIPKNSRPEIFQRIFALGILWGGLSRYAATPLNVALSPGQSDITRFHPWSPIVTGNHLDRTE